MGIKLCLSIKAHLRIVTDPCFTLSSEIKREKRSLSLYGHRTSVALETPFWTVIEKAAAARDMSLAGFLCALDDARVTAKSELGLAAYLRVWAMVTSQEPL